MDKDELSTYLKSSKYSTSAIERTLWALDVFETWLKEKLGSSIDADISPEDLEAFIHSVQKKQTSLLLGLANVFEFQGKETLKTNALKIRSSLLKKRRKPMKLRDFIGVDPGLIDALKKIGVEDARELLKKCKTPEARHKLADELELLYQDLLDLVKMADLSRMLGVKAVRTRLYLESGFDTLDKLAAQDPMELHLSLVKFVEESGFNGIATLPKEAIANVKSAQKIDRWVIFSDEE
jgi:hypothetical protein